METRTAINVTCPECRGPVSEIQLDDLFEYRCLVGHAYSARSVLEAHSETQERALWSAVVALEESAKLVEAVGPHLTPDLAQRLKSQAEGKVRQAAAVRRILEALEPFQLE
jgi:two-component system chemotaxis response regulator CheB